MAKLDDPEVDRSFRRRRRRRNLSPPPASDWSGDGDEPLNSPPRPQGRRRQVHRPDPDEENSSSGRLPRSTSTAPGTDSQSTMPLKVRPLTGLPTRTSAKSPFYDDALSKSDSRRTQSHRDGSPRSHRYRSTLDSQPSSRTSVTQSDDEADLAADRKDKAVEIVLDEEALRDRIDGTRRREGHHRRHEKIIYEEDFDSDREHRRPPSPEGRRPPSPRHHHSDRTSHRRHSSHRQHRHSLGVEQEGRARSSSKRSSRRYYESEHPVVYVDRQPSLRRSHNTGGGSHATSSVTSSRRSSLLGNFFGVSNQPPPAEKPVRLVECVVCMDDVASGKAPKLKCGHRMCWSCLRRSFKLSTTDPQHMPPKCCTKDVIPLKHVEKLFDKSFKKTWNQKFREFSTRNRIYCPSRRCGEWIKPENISREEGGRKMARCGRCKTKVCCQCNGKWHTSRECPKDEETKKFLEQAKQEGWQRCHRCKVMVELKEGCNHMTCRCGAEFCMICGTKWKSCDCPWFNFDPIEADHLEHMPIPLNIRPRRSGEERPSPRGFQPRPPRTMQEEMLLRRLQEQQDGDLARRLQAFGNFNDDDDDDYNFQGGIGDITGIGNQSGHFMNDDYRRRSDNIIVPPPPPAAAPANPPFERPSGGDYVSGVNRARGVRGSSMERRLADRFVADYRNSPRQGVPGVPPPPPMPIPPLGRGARPGMPPVPGMPVRASPPVPPPVAPLPRRHTMDVPPAPAAYDRRQDRRSESPGGQFDVETPVRTNTSSRRRRKDLSPRMSALAGLTGVGRGMNRVYEWAAHVEPGAPEEEASATAT